MSVFRLLIAAAFIVLAAPAFSAGLSSLEEQMTGAEFQRSGLEKLSEDELRFLNEWLKGRRLVPSAQPQTDRAAASPAPRTASPQSSAPAASPRVNTSDQGFELRRERTTIRGRLAGPFDGWSGKTEFVMENGMVWQQAESGRHGRPVINRPEIRIEPGVGGSWRLYVEGSNRSLKVKRIK